MNEKAPKKATATSAKRAAVGARPPVVPLTGLGHGITAEGDEVRLDQQVLLKHVGGVTVLNTTVRSELSQKQTEVFDEVLFQVRSAGRPVERVESFADFFNPERQFSALLAGTPQENMARAQALGLPLEEGDFQALVRFAAVRDKVKAYFTQLVPPYPYAKKQAGENKLNVTKTQVSNGRYHVTTKQAENLWKRARRVWESQTEDDGRGQITAEYSSRPVTVRADSVVIGCQTISRWQVEQLAVAKGWLVAEPA